MPMACINELQTVKKKPPEGSFSGAATAIYFFPPGTLPSTPLT